MSLVSNADLQAICDKLARWGAMSIGDAAFNPAFTAGIQAANAAVMSGSGSLFTYLAPGGTTTNGDLTADLLPAARDLDEANPVPPTRFLVSIASVNAFLTAINNHLRRYAPATPTLDAYLTALNTTTPTLRIHQALHDHLKAFSRRNVFIANDTTLATLTVTGAAAGTFASVATIGVNYAGAKLVVKNQTAVTTGATLTVTGKKIDGTTASLTATIATGTINTETDLSVTTKLFTEVTAITITGGTAANVYRIVAKTDRDISAA